MKTDGLEIQMVYEHTTTIRDIAFDSDGNHFFSAVDAAGRQGFVYYLSYMGAYEDAGPPWHTIDFGAIGGSWSGHFAFDPSNRFYVSTGSRSPGAIYARTASGFERRYRSDKPIAGIAFQSSRRLLFANDRQTLYALEDFSDRETIYSGPRTSRLQDVAVVTEYEGETCSISGRLEGGVDLWNQTVVNVLGPNLYWRDATALDVRVARDGSYAFEALPPGDYRVFVDIRGDARIPGPLDVVCSAGRRVVNQNFRFG
jgi:hypothetical protein